QARELGLFFGFADAALRTQRGERRGGRRRALACRLDDDPLEVFAVLLTRESLLDRALVGRVEQLALLGRELAEDLLMILVADPELRAQAVEDRQLVARDEAVGDHLAHRLLVGAQPRFALLGALGVE